MATLKQIEAARRNGKFSRGPVTAEGKARSARNAETHGIYGSHVVLATESLDAYDAIKADTIAHYQPADEEELELVTDLVDSRWRLHRLITMERAAMDNAIKEQPAGTETTRASNAFFSLADRSRGLALLQRQERSLRRAVNNALVRLDKIRASGAERKSDRDASAPAPEPVSGQTGAPVTGQPGHEPACPMEKVQERTGFLPSARHNPIENCLCLVDQEPASVTASF